CTWSINTLTHSSQRVLILAPHPDDESLGCGGTATLLSRAGVPVDVAFMTRGELGGKPGFKVSEVDQLVLSNQRAQEGVEACQALGVERVYFLSGHDGQVDQQSELSDEIFALLATGEYSTVFGPWPFDAHTDHCATFDWLVAALKRYQANLEIWLYEVWSTL